MRDLHVSFLKTTEDFFRAFIFLGAGGLLIASGIFSNDRRTIASSSLKSALRSSSFKINRRSMFFGHSFFKRRRTSRMRRLPRFLATAVLKTFADVTKPTLVGAWLPRIRSA